MAARRRSRGRPAHPDVLTPVEWAVLLRVREGLSDRAIADARGTTTDAVRYHVRNLLEKLQLPDRDALARWEGRRLDPGAFEGIDLAAEDRRIRMTAPRTRSRTHLTANATTFLVSDVARTAEWYRDVLGLEIGEVRSRGAELIQEPHERLYDMREFMVRTPAGHAITFGE